MSDASVNVFYEFLIVLLVSFGSSLGTYLFSLRILQRAAPVQFPARVPRSSPYLLDRLFLFGVFGYVLVFATLSILRYLSFHSGIDLGLYDQLVWNSLRGRLFENSLLPDVPFYLGKSFSPILLAFVPFYAVWRDPSVVLVVQTLALGAGALPIYWFAREQVGRGLALVIGSAYLLSPAVQSVNFDDVHGIAFSVPVLSFATYFLLRRRYKAMLACLGVGLLIREEIALTVIAFGAYMFLFQHRRWQGLMLSLTSFLVAVTLLTYVIPFLQSGELGTKFYYFGSGNTADAQTRYTYLGQSVSEIIITLITRPDVVMEHVLIPDKIGFVLHLVVPLGLLPVIGTAALLALPTLGYSLLSTFALQYSIYSFYDAPLISFLFFATVQGTRRVLTWGDSSTDRETSDRGTSRLARRYALGSWILIAATLSYYLVARGPLARHFDPALYSLDAHTTEASRLIQSVPSNAVVTAQKEYLGHLSARQSILEFPSIPDYRQADYLVADTQRPWYNFHKKSWDYFLGTGYFEIVSQQDGIIIARRRSVDYPIGFRYDDQLTLLGYTLVPSETLRGGMNLSPIVSWRAETNIQDRYSVTVQVVDRQGHVWAREDREPVDGLSPTSRWKVGETVGDQYTLRLPPTIPGGDYAITVGVHKTGGDDYQTAYDEQGKLLGDSPQMSSLRIEKNKSSITASELNIEQPLFVDMQEIRFLGYNLPQRNYTRGEAFHLGIYWRAREKPIGDYAVAVQLRDLSGRVIVEHSSRPANGTYPTTAWDVGEVLLDWHDFDLSTDIALGEYQLFVLLRDQASGIVGEVSLSTISVLR